MSRYLKIIKQGTISPKTLANWDLPKDLKDDLIEERGSGRMEHFRSCYANILELTPEAEAEVVMFLRVYNSPLYKALK